jgi:hypothetical protein
VKSIDECSLEEIEELERGLTLAANRTGRRCDGCTLCCKVVPCETAEFTKPIGEWCKHCKIGKGCAIYAARPGACRTWSCQWLIDSTIPEHWYPAKSKMVLQPPIEEPGILQVHVDPGAPARWRDEPWINDLRFLAKAGLEGWSGSQFSTMICINGKFRWVILPNKEVEWTGPGIAMRALDGWNWVSFPNDEATLKMNDYLQEVAEWVQQATPAQRLEAIRGMEARAKGDLAQKLGMMRKGFEQKIKEGHV